MLGLLAAATRSIPAVRGTGRLCTLPVPFVRRHWTGRAVVMDVHGTTMRLEPRELLDCQLIFAPQWFDRHEFAALRDTLRPGDTYVDLGANIGSLALEAARLVGPRGTVVAVEANPAVARILQHNCDLNSLSNVRVEACGVSDTHEQAYLRFQTDGNRAGSTFLALDNPHYDGSGAWVECRPLADLAPDRIRLLKLDVEGMEHRILTAFLRDTEVRPDYVLTEEQPGFFGSESAVDLLRRNGYEVVRSWTVNHLLVNSRLATPL